LIYKVSTRAQKAQETYRGFLESGGSVEVRFDDCAFDAERRQVFRAGQEVHLSRKAFDLLGILIASQPRVVSKSELLERLWPQTFVVEGNLSNLVAEVRQALQDDPHNPRFVRTAHGLGYAFCGSLSPLEKEYPPTLPAAECWLVFAGGRVPLGRGEHLIGRSARSVVPIEDMTISRHHARILVDEQVTLLDLGSRNGTYVSGERVKDPRVLRHGDRLTIGSVVLTVLLPQHGYATTDHTTQAHDTVPPFYVPSSTASTADHVGEVEPNDTPASKPRGH
jgi:DNA-binding winged helix-turn-helix (wHTH) protein